MKDLSYNIVQYTNLKLCVCVLYIDVNIIDVQ